MSNENFYEISNPYIYSIHVRPEHINQYEHVDNVQYLKWMLESADAHSASLGWGHKRYLESGGAFFVRKNEIDYLAPAILGDQLQVGTWCGEYERSRIVRYYEIIRVQDKKIIAWGRTVWVYVDLKSGRPQTVPDHLKKTFPTHFQAIEYFNSKKKI